MTYHFILLFLDVYTQLYLYLQMELCKLCSIHYVFINLHDSVLVLYVNEPHWTFSLLYLPHVLFSWKLCSVNNHLFHNRILV
jgi:hypothetical protein